MLSVHVAHNKKWKSHVDNIIKYFRGKAAKILRALVILLSVECKMKVLTFWGPVGLSNWHV